MSKEEGKVMCDSLIEWFKTLNVKAPHSNAEELSDGLAIAQALNQFSPDVWTEDWLAKIKATTGTNWRLKLSNLRKVVESICDYFTDVLAYNLTSFPCPEPIRIAESCDIRHMKNLLQLVLGCAVNCSNKDYYIQEIMYLEQGLQKNLMLALQELETARIGNAASFSSNAANASNSDLKAVQEERDNLAQRCYEADKKIKILTDEKLNLQQELSKVQEKQRSSNHGSAIIDDDGVSLGPVQTGSVRFNEMRRQLDTLKEELQQSEATREDARMRIQMQDDEIRQMQQRIEELTRSSTEIINLRDEVDMLRESSEKLKIYETQLVSYKKKMEEFSDLKKEKRRLEERNTEYAQQVAQLEDEAKRYVNAKAQIDLYKKEIQDLHNRLDTEANKNVKLEFENKNLENNIQEFHRVKDSLLKERDNLKETIEELKYGEQFASDSASLTGTNISKELHPGSLLDKVQRLESENKALREGQGGQTALAQLLEEANKRCDGLREQLKSANERILTLSHTSQINEVEPLKPNEFNKQIKQLMELNEQKSAQLEEANAQNANMQCKITQLEEKLTAREQELAVADTRYRKSVEKAKEVIKCLDPRVANVLDTLQQDKSPEGVSDEHKPRILEDQLMATAFYRLGINAQKDAMETKIAMLVGQGQTFLGRQRQSAPRKSLNATKSK